MTLPPTEPGLSRVTGSKKMGLHRTHLYWWAYRSGCTLRSKSQ